MTIMIVISHFYPKIGGGERVALECATGYIGNGHKVTVVTSKKGLKRLSINLDGIKVIYLPSWITLSNTPFNPMWFLSVRRIIRQENPDIIQAHSPVPGLADIAFALRGKRKFVLRYQSGSMKKNKKAIDLLLNLYEKTILRFIFKHSDAVSTSYEPFVRELAGSAARIIEVTPGIDHDLFRPLVEVKKSSDLLYVGRIDHSSSWKGIETLMKSVEEISKSRPGVMLSIVGTGDAVDHYKQLAKSLGIEKNVKFEGVLRDSRLVMAYNSSRVLVLPSETESESFGIVLIEAMACGVPVVGSRVGGITKVIKDGQTGFLVPPKNVKALTSRLCDILDNEELEADLGINGREFASQKYSKNQLITAHQKLFDHLQLNDIVHVSAKFPPVIGGLEKVVSTVAAKQSDDGLKVSVITSSAGYKQTVSPAYPTYPVYRLRCLAILNTPIMPSLLYRLLKIRKNAVVHLHIAHALIPEIVLLASKIRGFKYVAHIHTDVVPSSLFGRILLETYKKVFLKRVIRNASMVLVPTEFYKNIISVRYGVDSKKVKVVPNGTDYTSGEVKTLNINSKEFKLLYVGRFGAQKNLFVMVDSIRSYLDTYGSNISLGMVGDGPLKNQLNAYIKKTGVSRILKIENELINSETEPRYSKSDLFLFTSLHESFGISLVEAMSKGLPIVGIDIPEIRSIVRQNRNGLFVDNNPTEIACAIHRLITDQELYNKISENNLRDAKKFSWSKVISQLNALYEII